MNPVFFLPWEGIVAQKLVPSQKIFTPKGINPLFFAYDDIHNLNKPFLSIPNPSGTVKFFLEALHKKADEEAIGYISHTLWNIVNLEELRDIFRDVRQYQCFVGWEKKGIRIVSLAVKNDGGKTDIISLKMVEEPNVFGKWKIYYIEKE